MVSKQPVAGPSRLKANSSQAPPPSSSVASFNPSRTLFACAQPILGSADKLTVWDIVTDRVIAEWEVEGATTATTVSWISSSGSSSKKKRRRKAIGSSDDSEDVVVLTTGKGSLVTFAPRTGEVLRRIEVGQVTASAAGDRLALVTSKDILIYDEDVSISTVSYTFPLPAGISHITSIAILPSSTPEVLHLLLGSSSVTRVHLNLANSKISYTSSPLPVSTSSISRIYPLPSSNQGQSFLVVCDDDRSVSQYTFSNPTSPAKLSYRYASPTLSPAHSVSISSTIISVLHASGEVSLFPTPSELDFSRPKSDSKPSTLQVVEGKDNRPVRLIGAAFPAELDGTLLCGKLTGGGRVKWSKPSYELPEGGVRAETIVKTDAQDLVASGAATNSIPLQRFSAPTQAAEVQDADADEGEPASTLPTDVDMADRSLGERLLALPNGNLEPEATPTKAIAELEGPVNAASLTRVLVQALHTSDPALLTVCLSHRDPVLIRNTIRKMPAQMALPLLRACVERLGQGKASGKRGGGRGVAQNEQQGRGTVEWVKGVLVERGAVLMTMPSLPLHLANLSNLLQTRMQLYQPLLSLSGRLDLALAQIAMRRLAAEQLANAENKPQATRFVEGESDDEDDNDVHVEVDDGDGEIEDIDMRDVGSDEEEDSDEESDDDVEEESEEDLLDSDDGDDGFLDLEAEEESGSGESDEED